MIQSMTGYSSKEEQNDQINIRLEARSVNSRFLDMRVNLPKGFNTFEEKIKDLSKKFFKRGKLDVSIHWESTVSKEFNTVINKELVTEFKKDLEELEASLGRKVDLSFNDLLKVDGLIEFNKQADVQDKDEIWKFIEPQVEVLFTGLKEMRSNEGGKLKSVLLNCINASEAYREELLELKGEVLTIFKAKIEKNLKLLNVDLSEDDIRIQKELGLLLDKCDITEELDRLNVHFEHFKELLESSEIIGKKLDFLTQEMNREVNTICSKSNHSKIVTIGVNMKSEIEKVREQVQNIE